MRRKELKDENAEIRFVGLHFSDENTKHRQNMLSPTWQISTILVGGQCFCHRGQPTTIRVGVQAFLLTSVFLCSLFFARSLMQPSWLRVTRLCTLRNLARPSVIVASPPILTLDIHQHTGIMFTPGQWGNNGPGQPFETAG